MKQLESKDFYNMDKETAFNNNHLFKFFFLFTCFIHLYARHVTSYDKKFPNLTSDTE